MSGVSGSAMPPTFMRSPKESRRSTGAVFVSSHRRLRVDSLLQLGLLARKMNCRSRSHSRVFCFSLMLHLQKRLYDIVLRPAHQKQEETYCPQHGHLSLVHLCEHHDESTTSRVQGRDIAACGGRAHIRTDLQFCTL